MGKSSRTGLKLLVDRIHCLLSKGKLYAERVGTEAIDGPSSQSDGVSGCCQRSRNLLTNATRAWQRENARHSTLSLTWQCTVAQCTFRRGQSPFSRQHRQLRTGRKNFWRLATSDFFLFPQFRWFLANVNSSSCSLYVIVGPSVCLSSVTLMHPTQAIEIFRNISTTCGTLAIHELWIKILRRSSQGNPSVGGVKHKRGSRI